MRFEHIGVLQGMSQNSVLTCIQDRQGFIWSGSYDGLNRYDGTGFTVFRHSNTDSTSLPKNWVSVLFEDKRGVMWVGTNGGGLAQFIPSKRAFVSWRADNTRKNSLPSNEITAITEDAKGNVWIGTSSGLCRFNSQTRDFTSYSDICKQQIPNQDIISLYTDKQGLIWIGTRSGAAIYDINSNSLTQLNLFSLIPPASRPNFSNNLVNTVQSFLHDKYGIIWIGTRGALFALKSIRESASGDFSATVYSADAANPRALASANVQSLMEDRDGHLWFGTKNGLHFFDRSAQAFVRFQHDEKDPSTLSENFVMSMLQDKSGVLWFGTSGGGFSKYDVLAHRFPLYSSSPHSAISLFNDHCNAFAEDTDGRLWIGTDAGINILNRTNGTIELINQANTPILGSNHIRAFAFDKKRKIMWIGTDNGINEVSLATLSGINPARQKQWKFHGENPANSQSLISNRIISLALEENGTLWVGTFDGLASYSPSKNLWQQYRSNPSQAGTLSNNLVFGIVPEKNGTLWVGTDGGGLNLMNTMTGKVIEQFRNKRDDTNSLASDYILFLGNDADGERLCIGTDGGLSVLDKRTKRIKNYGTKNGLPNEIINAVLTDARWRYWISTNKGISCLNPADGSVRNFDHNDGLQSDEFNTGAYLQTSDKSLILGGILGFNIFQPDSILQNSYIPPVVFTGFRKFNKTEVPETAIEVARELILPYSDNTITFEFAALCYSFPERNRYKYMLEGLDKTWIDAGTKHEATYTNLDGGTYIFRVKAANSDGVWNEEGASIQVVIIPPFWKTLWFRLLAAILICSAIAGVYLRRVQVVKARNEELENLVKERTQDLEDSREQVVMANAEITRQLSILSEQTVEIELANSELHTMNLELEESYGNVQKLSEMGQNITAILDEGNISATAFNSFQALVDTSLFIISNYDDHKKECEIFYIVEHGVHQRLNEKFSNATLESIRFLCRSAEEGIECIIDNCDEYFAEQNIARLASTTEKMQSLITLPLIVEEKLIAILSVQSKISHAYSAYDLDIIRALASYTAIALANARAYKAVKDLNQEKNMLLGVVAHDLKSPLSSVILATSNLEIYWERMSREQIIQRMKMIQQTSMNMVNLIEDLLDVSSIESGNMRLSLENVALNDIIRKALEGFSVQASHKAIVLQTHYLTNEVIVVADYRRLLQILENLLSNAIKFSPKESTIHINIWDATSESKQPFHSIPDTQLQGQIANNSYIILWVRDEGPGLSADDHKQLFGKFTRLSARPTAGEHSSGLGLAIVKRLVEAMNGYVWCESELGNGATFFVALPRARSIY